MDRFAIVLYDGRYIPVRETELVNGLADLPVHSWYTGHVAAAHKFADDMTLQRDQAFPPTGELGKAAKRVHKKKRELGIPHHAPGRAK